MFSLKLKCITILFLTSAFFEVSSNSINAGVSLPIWAAVIDAGSTGSRIHIFKGFYDQELLNGEGKVSLFLPDFSLKVSPGVTELIHELNCENDFVRSVLLLEQEIRLHLEPLRSFMKEIIPINLWGYAPIFLRATGGLRQLPVEQQATYLRIFRKVLAEWEFDFRDALVMGGVEEGAFAWITLNELQHNIDPFENIFHYDGEELLDAARVSTKNSTSWHDANRPTSALVEMGGASAQFVTEIPANAERPPESFETVVVDSESCGLMINKNDPRFLKLRLWNAEKVLFSTSFPRSGRENALQRYVRYVSWSVDQKLKTSKQKIISKKYTCFPTPKSIDPIVDDATTTSTVRFTKCFKQVTSLFFDTSINDDGNSSTFQDLNYVTKIPFEIPPSVQLVATENFYYFNRFVSMIEDFQFSPDDFLKTAKRLCDMTFEEIRNVIDEREADDTAHTGCFSLIFMSSFLTEVIGVERDRMVHAVNQVDEFNINWVGGFLFFKLCEMYGQRYNFCPVRGVFGSFRSLS